MNSLQSIRLLAFFLYMPFSCIVIGAGADTDKNKEFS
ncbi:hypothetical protein Vi05172_g7981 [Venturia inaequalis]|nr:hypothetical protein Vi05172_g7981 [Venturia inaequalis]